jgi:hypothetical protein
VKKCDFPKVSRISVTRHAFLRLNFNNLDAAPRWFSTKFAILQCKIQVAAFLGGLVMVFFFVALLVFSSLPGIINKFGATIETVQFCTILATGIPLVGLITFADYAMYRAFQASEACPHLEAEASERARLHDVLRDSGRMIVYVDIPILFGLVPITALKVWWHFHGDGLQSLYMLGFTGGAIAMHLILGNLISLLFEFIDRENIFVRSTVTT